ncbi:hypothetical protein JCM17380_55030 [Desulfosporosinus burensis]
MPDTNSSTYWLACENLGSMLDVIRPILTLTERKSYYRSQWSTIKALNGLIRSSTCPYQIFGRLRLFVSKDMV